MVAFRNGGESANKRGDLNHEGLDFSYTNRVALPSKMYIRSYIDIIDAVYGLL